MLTDLQRSALVLLATVAEAGVEPEVLGELGWWFKRANLAKNTLCCERIEITRAGRAALAAHGRNAANVTR